MKFKLDENIGRRGLELLRRSGHDAVTVRDQGLAGAKDRMVLEVSSREERVLVTLDREFGQVLRYRHRANAGVVVLEPGSRVSQNALLAGIEDFLAVLKTRSLAGEIWIVEPGRIRVRRLHSEE